MRSRRLMHLFGLAFAAVVALAPVSAYASDFRLRVEDLTVAGKPDGYGVVITDGGVADEQPLDGWIQVTLNPLDSNVTWNLTMGMSKPVYPVDGSLAGLFLNSFNITSTGAATIRVTLEDTGFGGGASNLLLTSNVGGNYCVPDPDPSKPSPCASGDAVNVSSNSWVNTSNAAPDLGTETSSPASLSAIGASVGTSTGASAFALSGTSSIDTCTGSADPGDQYGFCDSKYTSFVDSGPSYSLFTQLVIQFSGAGSIDFYQDLLVTQNDQLTPEPGVLMLIGTGLAGFVARRRYMLNV